MGTPPAEVAAIDATTASPLRLTIPTPGSSRMSASERRRQLLDVALALFAEHGFHETSMQQVAEAAGVTKPVLYQHFGSKQGLYVELVEKLASGLQAALVASASEDHTARERMVYGMRAYLRWSVEQGAAYRVIFAERNWGDSAIGAAFARIETMVANLIEDLIDEPDLDPLLRHALALGIVGMAEYASRQWMLLGEEAGEDLEAFADRVSDLIWSGLGSIAAPTEVLRHRLADWLDRNNPPTPTA